MNINLPEKMVFPIQGNMRFPMPDMVSVKQSFSDKHIADVETELLKSLNRLESRGRLYGKTVAIGIGSRMVTNMKQIVSSTVKWLRLQGAAPFIVPAMGSHGGADALGQVGLLESLGITEESTGAPIRSSMEVVRLAELEDGTPVYCDSLAAHSDGIIICQRIKPHTSISAPIESGICKGMTVGLGKHKGARMFHKRGYDVLGEVLEQTAKAFVATGKILFAIGIVENAFEQTMMVEAIGAGQIIEREKELLKISKENMPSLQFEQIDVLIIDRIGKDINGCGCDPNITGRPIAHVPPKNKLRLQNIVALDLTDASHGNACGIGVVDFITKKMLGKISFVDTYTNVITSGATMAARLPIITDNDEQAVRLAMLCSYREHMEDVRVVHIMDTLHLTQIDISRNMLKDICSDKRFSVIGPGRPLNFDDEHALVI